MNVYLFAILIFIIVCSLFFNIYKKKQREGSKAPDVVILIGFTVAIALGVTPALRYGTEAWTWNTTVLVIASIIGIGRILFSWSKAKRNSV
ncbi:MULTISPECIES: hypothetical protein [Bacillales]|uniref:hypothetical protein n=1 Tax=Bacillales TaxID=1385 RepID=UPI000807F718|nr:hypothetical protein [Bacillus sp. FJAT-27264]OBZ14884.1 hypothetical protein A8L34_13420 [Bacillus sp. FJAT-27264]